MDDIEFDEDLLFVGGILPDRDVFQAGVDENGGRIDAIADEQECGRDQAGSEN